MFQSRVSLYFGCLIRTGNHPWGGPSVLRGAIYGRMGVAGLKDINIGSPKLYQTDAVLIGLRNFMALFDHNLDKISQI